VAYPAQWEADVVLADGGTVHLRPIREEDSAKIAETHSRLSDDSIYLRFFTPLPRLSPELLRRFTHVDYVDRMALVAELQGEIVAVARYDADPDRDAAEVAFTVIDEHQGRGLGTVLLEHLAAVARHNGIHHFHAEVLPQNSKMLNVFHDAGFADERHFDSGVVQVRFSIEPTEASLAAMAERERVAAGRSVERLLAPRSIAVIGAGREPGGIGHAVFRNLIACGFQGPVYPVHPSAPHIASVRAYPSVLDIPHEIDLAVIVVPAAAVSGVVEDCARKRVRGLIVISAGFAETGPEGAGAERALVEQARRGGMRLVGPNCMGVVNTSPLVSMNASFATGPLVPGRVAFSSQSGALGIAILEETVRTGLGVSTFVSVGNKGDVSSNDLLQYWGEDDNTDVVLLYLESFGNPRAFSRIARRVSRRKPIVAVKSGRGGADDTMVDALFRQTGVIRVDTLDQLFDVARALVHQPLPRGRGVAVVGNAAGPGLVTVDACEGAGLEVRQRVELAATAGPDDYERAILRTLADDSVDAVIAVFIPPLGTGATDVAAAIARAADTTTTKPVLANLLGDDIAAFRFPETAALALARAAEYSAWRERPEGEVPEFEVDERAVRMLVETVVLEHPDGAWLDPATAADLLGSYGIAVAPTVHVADADTAVAEAERIGFPVALKAANGDLVHKSDIGGVCLDLSSADEVRTSFEAVRERLLQSMGGAVVQAMVPPGVETVVAVVQDPSFGPLVAFGIGGPGAELLDDTAYRVLPLTGLDAAELVRGPRRSPLLFGYRGAPPADADAVEDLLLRVGKLVDDVPEVAGLELDPVIVSPKGAVAVDVKVRLEPYVSRPELAMRRLR
jgi:acyl-CoA synthetase (NDP forming)/GNAT superfamily N-acetyltransferase